MDYTYHEMKTPIDYMLIHGFYSCDIYPSVYKDRKAVHGLIKSLFKLGVLDE